ncbi:ABC transporter ATP-binding protein [Nocardioides sp. J54]|uniref:ABC transporter ATP-binding protein n=1 Tax=Nocardioides sp. J54 TaxID=935866 RepID=UPI00068720AD|nr:ABC transporter ATP-binding protein [Nocardioides sp. J54]
MLELTDVTVAFDGAVAVDGVDLAVADGDVLAVLGPSGCGKSTLLRAVAGLEPAVGTIAWDGVDLAGTPTHRRGFALMFQDGQLFDHLTVARNVGYALRLRGADRRTVRREVDDLLELVGLGGYAERLPRTLSGGERQRVALARSLAARPRLLLLDEPLSALDASLRVRLAADLRRILTEAGTTALFVTHDQSEAFAVADRIAVMRGGRVVQEGPAAELWRAPVDAPAARSLGYSVVLDGDAATLVARAASVPLEPGGQLAVRSSGIRALPADGADGGGAANGAGGVVGVGGGSLPGTVRSVRLGPDGLRLDVDVDGAGRLAALADAATEPAPGDRVRLHVDAGACAALPPRGAGRWT